MRQTRCVVHYPRSQREPRTRQTVLVIVLIILSLAAVKGWSLTDVTALVSTVAIATAQTAAGRPRYLAREGR